MIKKEDVRKRIRQLRDEGAQTRSSFLMRRWWRLEENVARFVADRLPARLIYFALIRAWVYATSGKWSSEDITVMAFTDVLKRWERLMKGKAQ